MAFGCEDANSFEFQVCEEEKESNQSEDLKEETILLRINEQQSG